MRGWACQGSAVGGVRLNLASLTQVSKAYGEIILSARAHIPHAMIGGMGMRRGYMVARAGSASSNPGVQQSYQGEGKSWQKR